MEVIDDFDRALKVMKKDAGNNPELLKKVEELEKTRPELIKAVLTKNHKKAMEILEKAFEVEREIHEAQEGEPPIEAPPPKPSEKPPLEPVKHEEIPPGEEFALPEEPQPIVKPIKEKPKTPKPQPLKAPSPKPSVSEKETTLLLPESEKTIGEEFTTLDNYAEKSLEITKKTLAHPVREMTEEEKVKLEEWNKKRLQEIEEEFRRIAEECERIKANWKNIEDIKGDYSELANQIKEVRKEVEKLLREKERIQRRIRDIKKRIDDLHLKKNQEFGVTKDTYKYFWNELLMVSVKLVEIEELLEKNEQVTDVDLLELKKSVEALEEKLNAIHWIAKKKALATSKVRPAEASKTKQAMTKSKHR